MTDNLGRKGLLIVVLTLLALAAIFGPLAFDAKPFRLGLDLQGGTRLVYSFDFDAAHRQGLISDAEFARQDELIQEFLTIIHGRVDPKGVMELKLNAEGKNRIVIELPGAAELATSETFGQLAKPLSGDINSPEGRTIELVVDPAKPQIVKAFPLSGGDIQIGSEKIIYRSRSGGTLIVGTRGAQGTQISAHDANAQVELLTNDDLQKRIENVGDMRFFLAADAADITRLGSDLSAEQKKVDTWRAANPNSAIDDFNRLSPAEGGPVTGLSWYPRRFASDEIEVANDKRQLFPLVLPHPKAANVPPEAWTFTGSDLASVGFTTDDKGLPAVAFEIATEKKIAFGDFTEANIERGMAIVLNGEIATLATIQSKLPGGGLINGGVRGFTSKEVSDLISVLRSGSLRIKPHLEDKARVGASLGEAYVWKGLASAFVALAVIVGFMLYFYRKLGWFSIIGLTINLILLLGSLAFLRATLTLPGVAGVILTLGMAVDGNILIYERLREEMGRGLKLVQAVKSAFERAAVTILDSNLTTLIAGVILYFVGTGPIRGFATTLNVGIISTLFTVIVVTEVLVLRDVKKGAKPYKIVKVLENPKIAFMDAAKYAIGASILLIVVGLALFAWLPNSKKLGIDFLGGFTVTARTQEPQSEKTISDLVSKIPGSIGESAQVVSITDSGDSKRGYTTFRITFKLSGEESEAAVSKAAPESEDSGKETGEKGLNDIKKALKSLLQRGPIEVALTPGEATSSAKGEIYFEDDHPQEDVIQALTKSGIVTPAVTPLAGHPHSFAFTGEVAKDKTQNDVTAGITASLQGFTDSKKVPYRLMSPLPESSFVGAQVGGELRDKAVLAVLLSLLGTVLYLRVRFAEYSFGIAVVVSLLHDVLIAIGAIAFAAWTGILQAELDLSMIAAFLTIIGYSQNDTIVIFDRVRENIPKSKKPLRDVLNDSINECLGRTILTTSTVVLTLLVLFLFNVGSRNVLEGFSYCMLVGVISGAYSTVYVAGPVWLWLEERSKRKALENEQRSKQLGSSSAQAAN